MSKTTIKKIVLSVLLLFGVFYLICLIFCTVSVFHIRTLTYSSTGWGVVLEEYKIDFVNNLAEVNYYDFNGTLKTHREDSFSMGQQMKLRLACAISFMPFWRSEYYNPAVLDGAQWNLRITYDEKEKKEKYTRGSNAYPLFYRVAYGAIKSVTDTIN